MIRDVYGTDLSFSGSCAEVKSTTPHESDLF